MSLVKAVTRVDYLTEAVQLLIVEAARNIPVQGEKGKVWLNGDHVFGRVTNGENTLVIDAFAHNGRTLVKFRNSQGTLASTSHPYHHTPSDIAAKGAQHGHNVLAENRSTPWRG
jgi:hypothetical protein